MFDYRIINRITNEVVGEYHDTNIEFDKMSPPQTGFITSNEMLDDLKNKKYNTRFYLISELTHEEDGKTLNQIYLDLKPFEDQKNTHLAFQVKFEDGDKYSTIFTATDLNYIVCLSRYDPFGNSEKYKMYNQVTFLCNME